MPLILVAALVIVGAILLVKLSFSIMGFLLTLAMAGVIGWLADMIVPGRIPYGWLGSIAAGLLGSLLGGMLMGPVGPELFGLHVLPALIGTVVLVIVAQLVGKLMVPGQRSIAPRD